MQGIYKIHCRASNKSYIGSSSDIEIRWQQHLSALRRRGHRNPYLQSAWNKYGEEDFAFEIVGQVDSFRDLQRREQEYLDEWFLTGLLYNINESASHPPNRRGAQMPQEARDRISQATSGANNPFHGKCHSLASRNKMSKSYKGWLATHEHPMLGKHHTQEAKDKLSKVNMGKKPSLETLDKRRASMKKWYKTHENVNRGKTGLYHHTRESKQKIRESRSKPYSAFYNVKTNAVIPAGIGLRQMCIQYKLNYGTMGSLNRRDSIQSKDGWRIVALI